MTDHGILAGRGIAVTGGGGHLGRAMALAVARAGATVIIVGRTAARLHGVHDEMSKADGTGRIVPIVADVSTDDGVAAALDAVEREAGSIDGWVNNAYASRGSGLLGSLTRRDVETTLARGLGDVIMATQAVAARMHDGGSILNLASMYGMVSPQPAVYRRHPAFHNPPDYGAAKAGVLAFTRYAAVHLAERGIRVNAIAPGAFPSGPAAADAAFVTELSARAPLGRIGRPEELGAAAVYLLSDDASFVTGQALTIDGGWTVW